MNESVRKLNKKWVYKDSQFYNRLVKSLLQNNNIEIYSSHNEGESVVAKRFIRALRNRMPLDVKSSTNIDFGIKNNDVHPKFKVGDHVTISKYEKHFF